MRLLFVQFGDFKEAYYRLASGGSETYYAQKFTVDWVANAAKKYDYVGVCCIHSENYRELLPNGVHAIGLNYKDGVDLIIKALISESPTHIICCSPFRKLLKWTIQQKIRTLPLLADSFEMKGWKSKLNNFILKRILNNSHFDWIANHNLNASLSLARIGVDASKILPWDFPGLITPDSYPTKSIQENQKGIQLLYVGNLLETKGVGDCITALKHLMNEGLQPYLNIVGPGDEAPFKLKAEALGVASRVKFLGRIGHDEILPLMHKSDLVLVPSQHAYAEGLPLTIYEGFCSHTPLVVSDHPMFVGKVIHQESGMVFKASDSLHLSKMIVQIIKTPSLYAKISANSKNAWERIQIPLKWDELLNRWLRNDKEDAEWLNNHSLTTYSEYSALTKKSL